MILNKLRAAMYQRLPNYKQLIHLQYRHKIWITKSEPPEWIYGEQDDLMNVELVSAFDKLKPGENPPYLVLDLRE